MWRSIFALAFAAAASAQSPCPNLSIYGRCELTFELTAEEAKAHPNPYASVQLHGEFRSPKFRTFLQPAFWDGANRLVIRFSPMDAGGWTYRLTSNIARLDGNQGSFTAAASDTPGFIYPRNVHHWSHTENNVPHLWMGDTLYNFAMVDETLFRRIVDARAQQRFTHMRGVVLGGKGDTAKAFPTAERPNPDFFRAVDERIAYMNSKGIIADLILGWDQNQLARMLPLWQDRERYLRYLVGRYSAYNITWELVQEFEEYDKGRDLLKELGNALKKLDPYNHPRSTHAVTTSAPLLPDGWMTHVIYQSSSNELGAIEHQLYPVPFVNAEFGYEDSGAGRTHPHHVDANELRRRLWNATMNGQYPTYGNTGTYGAATTQDAKFLDAPGAQQMKVWFDFFSGTRHWELEPYFDVDGGRAVALPGTEYIIYVEKPSGPVELRCEKHTYDVRWFNPVTGESTKAEEIKSERIVAEPPSRDHDWVLHVSREGRKRGMLNSYKFESRANLMQEIDSDARRVPFQIAQPSVDEFSSRTPPRYEVKLTRQTRGTRSMMFLWTGEVSIDSQGYRVVGTGDQGTLRIPAEFARRTPAIMNLRLYGMNANGKIYALDKILRITD